MAFKRPTLEELKHRIRGDINSRLQVGKNLERYDLLSILGEVEAGGQHSLYGALAFLSRQLFIATAEGAYLDRLLSWRGIVRSEATVARGNVELTGVSGSVIPENTALSGENSILYKTNTLVLIGASGKTTVEVVATQAGDKGNLPSKSSLHLVVSIAGVKDEAIVCKDGLQGGEEIESDNSYRIRAAKEVSTSLSRYGKDGDFAFWAKESSNGIDRAWEIRNADTYGTLLIQVARGNVQATSSSIQEAEKYILDRAPIGIRYKIETPQIQTVDLSLSIQPGSQQYQDKASDAIRLYFQQKATPNKVLQLNEIQKVVESVPNVFHVEIHKPTQDIPFDLQTLPVIGAITYV